MEKVSVTVDFPRCKILDVLREIHDSSNGGPFGEMTISNKNNSIGMDFELMSINGIKYVMPKEARKGTKVKTKERLQRFNVGALFESITLDILGHLLRTCKETRNIPVTTTYFGK